MALHEQSVGATDEWYTPAYVFEAMGVRFDQDPASPAAYVEYGTPGLSVPSFAWCETYYFEKGLEKPWHGFVWLNPPFGGRNGIVPWLEKFMVCSNGVCLVPDRTSAPWWQRFAPQADAALFVSPKIMFIDAAGRRGRSPAQGTVLLAMGRRGRQALLNARAAGLGSLWQPL